MKRTLIHSFLLTLSVGQAALADETYSNLADQVLNLGKSCNVAEWKPPGSEEKWEGRISQKQNILVEVNANLNIYGWASQFVFLFKVVRWTPFQD